MFEWLPDTITQLENSDVARKEGWRFVLNRPASGTELDRLEAAIGIPLPPSFRGFLAQWNGASLFRPGLRGANGQELLGSVIEILDTERIVELTKQLTRDWEQDDPGGFGNLFVVAQTPGTGGDYCGLNPEHTSPQGEYALVDCMGEFWPSCWRRCVVEESFEEWLRKVFDAAVRGDHYYWINLPTLRAIQRTCLIEHQEALAAWKRQPRPLTASLENQSSGQTAGVKGQTISTSQTEFKQHGHPPHARM
jgi:hypothetical protein